MATQAWAMPRQAAMILKARYVVPVEGPVIENGAVAIEGPTILAVGRTDDVAGSGPTVDYGDAVIGPGFVNAHTHLELSLLRGRVPPSRDFADWLRRLMAELISIGPDVEYVTSAVREGVIESLRGGVTTVGDITRHPRLTRPVLAGSPVRAVSFGEVAAIGNRRELLADRLEAAISTEHRTERFRVGVSPHSPYTLEPEGLRACAECSEQLDLPMCIHLAETPDEERFTRLGEGTLVEHLRTLGIWDDQIPIAGFGPIELADRMGVLTPKTLVAHANYVSDEDIERLRRSRASVAYCPRTHHAFGHSPHRFVEMMAAGINVCAGTDSLASNPSLSILDELRFLHRIRPAVDPATLLAMGTIRGARALGLEKRVGSLKSGKLADIVVFPVRPTAPTSVYEKLLESDTQPIAVYTGGRFR